MNPESSTTLASAPAATTNSQIQMRRQVGRTLLRELRRRKLGKVEYQLAELILELSYGWGMTSVVVPNLDIFGTLAGVARPHISTNLAALIEMGVLVVEKTDKGPRYAIQQQPAKWMVAPRGVSRAEVRRAITELRVFNDLEERDLPLEFQSDASGGPHFFDQRDGAKILAEIITAPVTITGELFPEPPTGGQPS